MLPRVLVADPPWKFQDRLPGKGRGAARQYRCMATEEIMGFSLPPLAADAYLFLWRVAAMQREALDVVDAWGFTVKSEMVWRKLTVHGLPWFGMGHHVRAAHEVCLVATRGKPRPSVRNIRSTFAAKVGRHSEKPDAFYSLVEQLAPGPYVELFARHQREGWECFGDELVQP